MLLSGRRVATSLSPNKVSALRRIVGRVSWYSIISPLMGQEGNINKLIWRGRDRRGHGGITQTIVFVFQGGDQYLLRAGIGLVCQGCIDRFEAIQVKRAIQILEGELI